MFDNILMVCTGNICRSPFAEASLQKLCPKKSVLSAGTDALIGYPADRTAIKVASKLDIDLNLHRGQQLVENLIHDSDLILVMEKYHQERIARISPVSLGKVMLIGHWLEHQEIMDPYQKSEEYFYLVFKQIQQACETWRDKIS